MPPLALPGCAAQVVEHVLPYVTPPYVVGQEFATTVATAVLLFGQE